MGRDNFADDCQAQAAAAMGRIAGHTEITLKYIRQELSGDSAAGIGD